jgi:hypothetical protein
MTRWLRSVVAGLVLGLVADSPAGAGELAHKLAAAAGPDTIAVIHAENFDATLKKADRFGEVYSAQVSAMFPLLAPMIIGQIDLTRPITALVANPKKYMASDNAPPAALVCTAREAQALFRGFGTAGTAEEGVTAYTAPSGKEMYGAVAGQEVLIASSRELAAAVLKAAPSPGGLPKVRGDIQARVPVADLLKLYAEEIQASKEKMFQAIQEEAPQQQQELTPEAMTAMLGMYFEWLDGVGRQIGEVGLGLEMDGGELVVHQRVEPVAGSRFEAMLKAQVPPAPVLLGGLPEDAPIRVGVSLRFSQELLDAYLAMFDVLKALSASLKEQATPVPMPNLDEMRPKVEAILKAMGPRIAGAVLASEPGKPALRLAYLFDHQNPEQFGQLTEEFSKLWMGGISELYKRIGMPMEMRFGPLSDPEAPAGTYEMYFSMPNLPQDQAEAFKRLYGDTALRVLFAPAGKQLVAVFGPDGVAMLKEWITRFSEPPAAEAAGLPQMPGARVAAAVFDLPAYMRMIFNLMPPEQAAGATEAMGAFLNTPQSLVMSASVEGSVLHGQVRYPLETTLKSIKSATDQNRGSESTHPEP